MNEAFYDTIRPLFGGRMVQAQVDGTEAICEAWREHGVGSNAMLAYVLATSKHETAGTMKPIHEYGGRAYFNKYEPGTSIGNMLGNVHPGDGYRYRGRGYVQLTGFLNYLLASEKLGVDFVDQPEKVLELPYAGAIAVTGMLEGWFTGRKLSDYMGNGKTDFRHARRIINGLDKADLIAGYANTFLKALEA